MFDISGIISLIGSKKFEYNKSFEFFLNKSIYIRNNYTGKNFSLTSYRFNNEPNTLYTNKDFYVFIIGEIYLRKSSEILNYKTGKIDAKNVFELYKEHGSSFINYIKGIFIVVIFDEKNSNYRFFNSKSGLLDFYYQHKDNSLLFSTSLYSLLKLSLTNCQIDNVSLIQHSIFDYSLGKRTLYKNINILQPGCHINYNKNKLSTIKYFDYKDIIDNNEIISWKQTYDLIPEIFNETLNNLIENDNIICASLTSGFDSRANLSYLINSNKNILFYSWGIPNSVEIKIPKEIAIKTGIKYLPIYLNNKFEEQYDFFGKQAVILSGGKGTIRRANHNYSYSFLSNISKKIVTGLFGSELLRPTNSVGHIFNKDFIDVFYSKTVEKELEKKFIKEKGKNLLNTDFLTENKYDFLDETLKYFLELKNIGEKYKQIYYFAINEGFRKYFGHEIHGNRLYCHITSPYIDDEFVEFLFKTPIPELNNYAFKRNPKSLKLGQSLYLPIFKNNYPKLMTIKTGRYFTPQNLQSKLFPLSIIPGYTRYKINSLLNVNKTFKSSYWGQMVFNKNKEIINNKNEFFNSLIDAYHNTYHDLAKHFSLRFWFNETS
ncbi:MAG: hypothetical protein KAT68_06215 [Bacteroidales bacterium]|nr:hypothetical protein [Bacteroidales bacterium]